MARPDWFDRADRLHRAIVAHRNMVCAPGCDRTNGVQAYDPNDGIFLAMKLAEEAGEVAGEFSRWMRGDRMPDEFSAKVVKELADVRCILELLARFVGHNIDLDDEVVSKLTEVEARWRAKGLEF